MRLVKIAAFWAWVWSHRMPSRVLVILATRQNRPVAWFLKMACGRRGVGDGAKVVYRSCTSLRWLWLVLWRPLLWRWLHKMRS
jgi:hypothetical protein